MTQSVTQLSCFGDLTNDIWVDVSDNFHYMSFKFFNNAYNYIILQNGIASLQSSNPVYNVLANSGDSFCDIVVIPDSSIGVLTCMTQYLLLLHSQSNISNFRIY